MNREMEELKLNNRQQVIIGFLMFLLVAVTVFWVLPQFY